MNRKSGLIIFGLVSIVIIVCMGSPLHPFSKNVPGTDSSVFLTVAQGILQGNLPYVNFFDHKGPLLYFINALGLLIGGLTGVWFLEVIFMLISVYFAYKTARFFVRETAAFLTTCFTFIILSSFFGHGNLVEEYVLPLIFISLYIFTDYFLNGMKLGRLRTFILGCCCGASLLLRPNMFAVWASFCPVIFIQTLILKDMKCLVRYAVFFLFGVIAVIAPVLLYLFVTHSFEECVKQYLLFNVMYVSSSARAPATIFTFIKVLLLGANKTYSIFPLVIASFWVAKKPRNKEYGFYIAYAVAALMTYALIALSRMDYEHYNMPLVPLFIPALSFCVEGILNHFSGKYITPVILLCIVFNYQIAYVFREIYDNQKRVTEPEVVQIGNMIDSHTDDNDTISVLGNHCCPYIYTKRLSVSKYIYQLPPAIVSRQIKEEYLSDMFNKKPAIIIISLEKGRYSEIKTTEFYAAIFAMVDSEYSTLYSSENYLVFKRNEVVRSPIG
jgi:hypothetical protein